MKLESWFTSHLTMLAESRVLNLVIACLISAVFISRVEAQNPCMTPANENGVCVPILECADITELLDKSPKPLPQSVIQLVRQSRCSTSQDITVCCKQDVPVVTNSPKPATESVPEPTPQSTTPDVQPQAGSPKTSTDVDFGMNMLEKTECGLSFEDRVANGIDAYLSQFPWMALLVYYDGVRRTLDCGGSLITDRYVLTAAHCVRRSYAPLVSVRLGEHDLTEERDCEGKGKRFKCAPPIQEIDVEEVIYHEDYQGQLTSNDIGLVRLVRKASLKTNVQPICLPLTSVLQTSKFTDMFIAGWGLLENQLKASILQKALVPIRENSYCQEIHKVVKITDKQMCAGAQNNIDTCKGDSGGPLFYASYYRKKARYVQFGITSTGSSECGSKFPGIFTKVSSYVEWIAGNLRS